MGLWDSAKRFIGGAGDIVKKAAPIAALIPGIGPGIAAVAGGLGGLAGTLNDEGGFDLGRGLKEGGLSALGSFGAGKLGSAVKGAGGISKLLGLGGISKAAPIAGDAVAGVGAGGGGGGGSRWSELARGVLGFARDNPLAIAGGIGMLSDARKNARAQGQRDEGLDLLRKRQEGDDAIRMKMMEMISNMGGGGGGGGGGRVPDLNDMFSTGGPYDRPVKMAPIGGAA